MAPKKEIRKIEDSGIFKKPVDPSKKSGKSDQSGSEKRKPSALEEIMREEEERKKKMVRLSQSKSFKSRNHFFPSHPN